MKIKKLTLPLTTPECDHRGSLPVFNFFVLIWWGLFGGDWTFGSEIWWGLDLEGFIWWGLDLRPRNLVGKSPPNPTNWWGLYNTGWGKIGGGAAGENFCNFKTHVKMKIELNPRGEEGGGGRAKSPTGAFGAEKKHWGALRRTCIKCCKSGAFALPL